MDVVESLQNITINNPKENSHISVKSNASVKDISVITIHKESLELFNTETVPTPPIPFQMDTPSSDQVDLNGANIESQVSPSRETIMALKSNGSRGASNTKLVVSMLQKYGYNLRETSAVPPPATSSIQLPENIITSSIEPISSAFSSSNILFLREPDNDRTALHIAVRKGHIEVLKALSKLPKIKELVNVKDKHGNTALHFAASYVLPKVQNTSKTNNDKALEMAKILIDTLKANVFIFNKHYYLPLDTHVITTKKDNPELLNIFLAKIGKEKEFHSNKKTLPEVLNRLLEEEGETILHIAIKKNLINISCALISFGASINIPNETGIMVCDLVSRKILVKLICFMKENQQAAPKNVLRTACKLCRAHKGLLESLKDCQLCGRFVCKSCSKKTSEIKKRMEEMNPHNKDKYLHQSTGIVKISSNSKTVNTNGSSRYCSTCCTVLQLKDLKGKHRDHFEEKLYGCS